jgi:hypothetical protein
VTTQRSVFLVIGLSTKYVYKAVSELDLFLPSAVTAETKTTLFSGSLQSYNPRIIDPTKYIRVSVRRPRNSDFGLTKKRSKQSK